MSWQGFWLFLPLLLPLAGGALLILIDERRHRLKQTLSLAFTLGLLGLALSLLLLADRADSSVLLVHLAGNWPAPFGIALSADRLSALMLLLTSVIALAALLFAAPLWERAGVHFHPLFQFLLMGVNGIFLTADLFNLFVFFEVMLAASYGLLLYAYNETRIRAGLHYVAINLLTSFFFLIGLALIYAGAGTLNMADLALRIPLLESEQRELLELGAAVLAIAFLTKSAAWPFCFWLPTTYAAAPAPTGALFVLMTKVGVYALLRLWLLLFSPEAGASAGYGGPVLLGLGLATLAYGSLGLLASQELGRMAGFSAIISSGILLAALGTGRPALLGSALFYLISSTLAVAALLLLFELVQRLRDPMADMLAVTMEAFAIEDTAEEPVGRVIPAATAFLGLGFVVCALVISGLPPLSGFLAKFGLLHALLNPAPGPLPAAGLGLADWLLLVLLILSGFVGIIALMRFGVRTFWSISVERVPLLRLSEAAGVTLLLLLCVLISVLAAPVQAYLERTSLQLQQPGVFAERILTAPVRPSAWEESVP